MIKTRYEIENLRYAAHQQWKWVHDIMMSIRPGDSDADIRNRIDCAVAQAPGIDGNAFLMLYMGRNPSATMRYFGHRIAVGDLVSIDSGVYGSRLHV